MPLRPPRRITQFLDNEPGVKSMLALGFMVGAFSAVESVTNNMIPITTRHFTDSAFLIAFIIALNRLFGFLVQPYIAWKSDRVRTRFGRRRPFLMAGLAFTAASLLLLGFLPQMFPEGARQGVFVLAVVLFANVSLQFFQDVNGGVQEPLYADTFRQDKLGRAVAIRNYVVSIILFTMNVLALQKADQYEWFPYVCAAMFILLALALVIFGIREREFEPPPVKERYNPIKHLGMLRHYDYAMVAVIASMVLILPVSFQLFTSLFATGTLGLTRAQLGQTMALGPVVTWILAFPVGYLVDRAGPRPVLCAGFLLIAIISAGMAFFVDDYRTLFIFMTINAGTGILTWGATTSFVFQYAAPEERGKVFGLIQFVRGASAFVISLGLGAAVQMSFSYDATPIYAADLKDVPALARRLAAPEDRVSAALSGGLSSDTQALLKKHQDEMMIPPDSRDSASTTTAALKTSLTADLNAVMDGPLFYEESMFDGVKLSRQSQRLLSAPELSRDEQKVLNRALLHDAYPDEISKKLNFRMNYIVNIGLALLAAALVFGAREGKYARTLKDTKQK